tara:strand:- start:9936 stop:11219 length:1284 start_codon:yes stop_codon:yes gene_type:complete
VITLPNVSGSVLGGNPANSLLPWDFPEVLDYYDARGGITQSGERVSAVAPSLKGADSLLQATGANQPIYLPYSGAPYITCKGAASNGLTAPNVSITGNVTITADVALDSYATGSQTLAFNITANTGFSLVLLATGVLRLAIGNGASTTTYDSTSAVATAAYTRCTILVEYTDGGSGDVKFYVDGVQLGATVNTTVTLSASSAAMSFIRATTNTPIGKFYGATITNGAGTTYYNWSSANLVEGATSFTGNDGLTYTIAVSGAVRAMVVARPWIVHDAAAYFMRAAFSLDQPCGVVFCGLQNTHTNTRALWDGAVNGTASRLRQNTSVASGIQLLAPTTSTVDGDFSLSTKMVVGAMLNGASSYMQVNQWAETASSPGTNNMGGITVGADSATAPTLFCALQWTAMAVVNQSMTPTRMRQLVAAMQRLY